MIGPTHGHFNCDGVWIEPVEYAEFDDAACAKLMATELVDEDAPAKPRRIGPTEPPLVDAGVQPADIVAEPKKWPAVKCSMCGHLANTWVGDFCPTFACGGVYVELRGYDALGAEGRAKIAAIHAAEWRCPAPGCGAPSPDGCLRCMGGTVEPIADEGEGHS